MTVADHLLALTLQGWQFWQSDGRLRYRVPQTATDTDAASSVLATLKPHKDEILKLLQEQPNFLEISPLSFSQKSLWFLWQLEPESWAYNVSFAGRLLNANNIQTWQKSFEQLIERHPTLRSRFSTLDGQPYQQILDVSILDFRVIDSMNWDEAKLQQELLSAHREPFNLGQGPILRVKCFLRPSQELVLFLSVHHIVCDGWSLNLLLAELPILYQKIQEGDTLLPTVTPIENLSLGSKICWEEIKAYNFQLTGRRSFRENCLFSSFQQIIPIQRYKPIMGSPNHF
jgi:Condensation domain